MKKDFKKWCERKEKLDGTVGAALFHEREVWWCTLGVNIGFEQDGNNELFTRPIVILTKFNLETCLVVPLTTKDKIGKYYFYLGEIDGQKAVAILSQLRFIDRKRLASKIATLNQENFKKLIEVIISVNFPTTHK